MKNREEELREKIGEAQMFAAAGLSLRRQISPDEIRYNVESAFHQGIGFERTKRKEREKEFVKEVKALVKLLNPGLDGSPWFHNFITQIDTLRKKLLEDE